MSAGVGAVIFSVVYDMGKDIWRARDPILLIIMGAALTANCIFHVNVIFIILSAAAVGLIRSLACRRIHVRSCQVGGCEPEQRAQREGQRIKEGEAHA